MSVSQFPNVTEDKCEILLELVEQLFSASTTDQAIVDELSVIFGAHLCAAGETILHSQKLQQHQPYDPATVQQIKDLLDSCR